MSLCPGLSIGTERSTNVDYTTTVVAIGIICESVLLPRPTQLLLGVFYMHGMAGAERNFQVCKIPVHTHVQLFFSWRSPSLGMRGSNPIGIYTCTCSQRAT